MRKMREYKRAEGVGSKGDGERCGMADTATHPRCFVQRVCKMLKIGWMRAWTVQKSA
jgi:hypothetical protein